MNQSKLHKLFEEPPNGLPRERLEAYLEGKLSPAEQHEVEMHLQACGLSDAAMDGFEANPNALAGLDSLQSEFHARLGTEQRAWWQKPAARWGIAGLLGGAALLAYFSIEPAEPKLAAAAAAVAVETPVEPEPEVLENFLQVEEEKDELLAEEIADPIEIEAEEELPTPIAEEVEEVVVEEAPIEDPERVEEVVDRMDEQVLEESDPLEEYTELDEVNPYLKFINRYKIHDYSSEYDNELSEQAPRAGPGLSARFEDEQARRDEQAEWRTITHSYDDVLELGIAHLDAGKHRKALNKFQLILTTYPDNQNGLFYGGFCYHHMRNYGKAIRYFDQVLEESNTIFREEARWYKALALMKRGNWESAKALMLEIEQEGGFYAQAAGKQIRVR